MLGYLRHLSHFAYAVEAGSITGAANKLRVSPSVVSESVKIVEGYFGERLLERSRGGVTLIGRGPEIYEEARQITLAIERVQEKATSTTVAGQVRVSVPTELLSGWFDRALARVTHDFPEIHLMMHAEDSVQDYQRHARDLYVRVTQLDRVKNLHILHQSRTKAVLVAHRDYVGRLDPNDIDAVSELVLIGQPKNDRIRTLSLRHHSRNEQQEIAFNKTLHLSEIQSRIAVMKGGYGATMCLEQSVSAGLSDGTLVRLLPDWFGVGADVVIGAPDTRVPARVREVAEILCRDLLDHA